MHTRNSRQDPRVQPGAYITDGVRLLEVLEESARAVVLENCESGVRTRADVWRVLHDYSLVRAAPDVPASAAFVP